jgi:ATP-dependent Clp protease ATP-binding subunit ClpA
VLTGCGLERVAVRERVEARAGRTDAKISGQIPFTTQAKKVMELALREALALGHNYIGTEHLLLGLARVQDGVSAEILADHGVDSEKVKQAIPAVPGGRPRPSYSTRWARRRLGEGWTYRTEWCGAISAEWLNRLGREGWELMGIFRIDDRYQVVFKRPV